MIVATPERTAYTFPVLSTVATDELEEVQVTELSVALEGKTTYDERKKKGIEVTRKLLEENANNYSMWFDKFTKHTKKDDLADAYLQALWYTRVNNM